jgi:hypothetical protein
MRREELGMSNWIWLLNPHRTAKRLGGFRFERLCTGQTFNPHNHLS